MMNPHVQRAQMLYQRSRYADAERELGMALQVDPHEPWAYALLGACRAAQKDFTQADELGRQAMSLAPDSADIRHLVARIQLARNDLPVALKTIAEAIELEPRYADFYATRATVYAQMKKWQNALADCESALEIDPEHVDAINVRSHARRAQGDTQAAADELRQALEVDPDDPYSHTNLGWTHLQRGELTEAERHFREALRLDPELELARVGVLETLKAKVPFYRWMLNYFIWMQTKAASAQWGIIIGLYIGYMVLRSVAANQPALAPFIIPLLILYSLFAVATWFAKPLADAILLFHPFGRMALTSKEKGEGAIVAALVVTVTTLGCMTLVTDNFNYAAGAILIGSPGLALAMSFKFEPRKPRLIMQAAAAGLSIVSGYMLIEIMSPLWQTVFSPGLHESISNLCMQILRVSFLAILIGTNVLASLQWKK